MIDPAARADAIPEVIRTDRLTLRPWRFEDLPDLLAYSGDPGWSRFLDVPRPYTEAHARQWLASQMLLRDNERSWAISLAERIVGSIDLTLLERGGRAGLGYSLAPGHWGKGLATEAARALIATAFEKLPSLQRIHGTVDPANGASARVLAKSGMTREGVLRQHERFRGALVDEVWYSILRTEWEAGRLP